MDSGDDLHVGWQSRVRGAGARRVGSARTVQLQTWSSVWPIACVVGVLPILWCQRVSHFFKGKKDRSLSDSHHTITIHTHQLFLLYTSLVFSTWHRLVVHTWSFLQRTHVGPSVLQKRRHPTIARQVSLTQHFSQGGGAPWLWSGECTREGLGGGVGQMLRRCSHRRLVELNDRCIHGFKRAHFFWRRQHVSQDSKWRQ